MKNIFIRYFKTITIAFFGLIILIQFIPIDRVNPPVTSEINPPPDVKLILKKSCYDCHSNETRWPWYSQMAPISWLVIHDVNEGREEMNFSTWNKISAKKQKKLIGEIWEEVEEGEMPLWFYLPTHPEARLTDADRKTLFNWAKSIAPHEIEDDD